MELLEDAELFRDFLYHNNILFEFNNNFDIRFANSQLGCTHNIHNLKEYMTDCYLNSYLSNAFSWISSPEGHEFWKEKSTEWRFLIKMIVNCE